MDTNSSSSCVSSCSSPLSIIFSHQPSALTSFIESAGNFDVEATLDQLSTLTLSSVARSTFDASSTLLSTIINMPLPQLAACLFVMSVTLFLFVGYYQWCWRPLAMHVPLPDKEREAALRRPCPDNVPSFFPNAWFKIADSNEVKIGEVKPIVVLGQELVMFRGKGDKDGNGRGQVFVMDAYCPHLGAHLGHGGTVSDNNVVCPFHGWEFSGDSGACERIPYAKPAPKLSSKDADASSSSSTRSGIPPQAKVACWPVVECNNSIFLWHDIDREAPPSHWSSGPPRIPNFDRMICHGRAEHEIACHIQEIPENGADTAHLDYLHGPFVVPAFVPWITHTWKASWTPRNEESGSPHVADIHLETGIASLTGQQLISLDVNIEQVGPGIVHLLFNTPFGRLVIFECTTPLRQNLIRATNIVYADPWIPRFVAKAVLKMMVTQFERDMPIWNNKRFVRAPMQVKDDGPLLKFRRWYQQFYSKRGTKVRASPALAADW